MTSAAILALLLGSWSCTQTFEKQVPTEMVFRRDRTVVTRFRTRGRSGPWTSDRERFAVRDGRVAIAPFDGKHGPTTVHDVRFDGARMILTARTVRPDGATAFMPFPGSDVSVCRKAP
jgi:hypothetical protein